MSGIISYARVSTAQQGKSGLGREAQQEAVHGFAEPNNFIRDLAPIAGHPPSNRAYER
jgi:hypothetical protein